MLAYSMVKPLDQLYEAHHGMVFRTAYRITGNAADAEDVLQTVFLRMVRRDTTEIENPESYLRRSAVNASLDVVRARLHHDELEPERMTARGDSGELRDALRKALAKLPERHAEMFVMRFFEGYSNPEIAKLLGISAVVVAVTLHRTRRRLQKEMR